MPEPVLSPIGPDQVALLARSVSVIIGSADDARRPHLMRAVGYRLSEDRRRLMVLLTHGGAQDVLADLRRNGRIAVVFSEPSTHRTLQVKGSDAVVSPALADDEELAARYLERFVEEIAQLGFGAEVARTLLAHGGDLMAVHFTVEAAFEQTPGPAAGEPLAAAGR